MRLKVFAMRDVKADAYGSPFFLPNEGLAIRMLGEWVQDKRSEVARYPADFMMFQIGEFDNESGELVPMTPIMVTTAVACLPKPDPRQLVLKDLVQNPDGSMNGTAEEVAK